jgi:hypothetical protein
LIQLYRVGEPSSKALALRSLAWLLELNPPETPPILAILTAAVRAGADADVSPSIALDALRNAGSVSIPVLRQLHAQGTVKDPIARMELPRVPRPATTEYITQRFGTRVCSRRCGALEKERGRSLRFPLVLLWMIEVSRPSPISR